MDYRAFADGGRPGLEGSDGSDSSHTSSSNTSSSSSSGESGDEDGAAIQRKRARRGSSPQPPPAAVTTPQCCYGTSCRRLTVAPEAAAATLKFCCVCARPFHHLCSEDMNHCSEDCVAQNTGAGAGAGLIAGSAIGNAARSAKTAQKPKGRGSVHRRKRKDSDKRQLDAEMPSSDGAGSASSEDSGAFATDLDESELDDDDQIKAAEPASDYDSDAPPDALVQAIGRGRRRREVQKGGDQAVVKLSEWERRASKGRAKRGAEQATGKKGLSATQRAKAADEKDVHERWHRDATWAGESGATTDPARWDWPVRWNGVPEQAWKEEDPPALPAPEYRDAESKLDPPEDADPLWFWQQLFTEHMIGRVVTQTNVYAAKVLSVPRTKVPNCMANWQAVDKTELLRFFGLLYWMGIHPTPDEGDHWSSDPLFRSSDFRSVMSRDRFRQLKRNIHVVDNSKYPPALQKKNPCWKISPLLKEFATACRAAFRGGTALSFDEMMVRCVARCPVRVREQQKPTPIGIRIWAICDAKTGYVIAFIVDDKKPEPQPGGKSAAALLVCAEHVANDGHIIFMDNAFTSQRVLCQLGHIGIRACGTLRASYAGSARGLMKKNYDGKILVDPPRGKWTVFSAKPAFHLYFWQDSGARPTALLSSAHTPRSSTVKRFRPGFGPQRRSVAAPDAFHDYNLFMLGVDKADQRREPYNCQRKSVKWWHALLFWTLETAMVNAHVLYKLHGGKLDHKAFRCAVTTALVFPDGVPAAEPAPVAPLMRVRGAESFPPCRFKGKPEEHRLMKLPPGVTKDGRRQCAYCYAVGGARHRTTMCCEGCHKYGGVYVGLCAKRGCNTAFHSHNKP